MWDPQSTALEGRKQATCAEAPTHGLQWAAPRVATGWLFWTGGKGQVRSFRCLQEVGGGGGVRGEGECWAIGVRCLQSLLTGQKSFGLLLSVMGSHQR